MRIIIAPELVALGTRTVQRRESRCVDRWWSWAIRSSCLQHHVDTLLQRRRWFQSQQGLDAVVDAPPGREHIFFWFVHQAAAGWPAGTHPWLRSPVDDARPGVHPHSGYG